MILRRTSHSRRLWGVTDRADDDGDNEDVEIQVYNAGTDTVLYGHSYQDHGPFPDFGDPIDVFSVGGDVFEIRMENDDPGTIEASGMIEWSCQTVLD